MTATVHPSLTHFRFSMDGDVAVVLIDREGDELNTLGPELIGDLETLLDTFEDDDSIRAVVIGSAKPESWVAGADINFFASLEDADAAREVIETTHALLARLERVSAELGKPVVAALHGAVLGGGLELALACSHRLAGDHPKTRLGFPEVQLGILPAAGGTQRLPATVGIAGALDMILTARPVRAGKARRMGLVDDVVPNEVLMAEAVRLARDALAGRTRDRGTRPLEMLQRLALESNPIGQNLLFKKARERLLAETGGNYPAPELALEAVRIGVQEGPASGYAAEAEFFARLVTSPESLALRSIFFATRHLEKDPGAPSGVEPRPVGTAAVIGGGLMGAGIATVTALHAGSAVRIKEVDAEGLTRALRHVAEAVADRRAKGRLSEFEAEKAMLRVTGSTTWTGFSGSDLVIEAVFEDLDLKRSVLADVEAVTGDETVFASNTSTLPISSIAAGSQRPHAVLGMHYFSPVERMPLLEVITTDSTADWAVATAVAFGKRQGKTVIVVNDGPGFYTTRVVARYSNEALRLLEEGAAIEAIDEAMESWGFPVGPLQLADEVGLDVGRKVGRIMADAFGARMALPAALEELGDDRKGRKNRRGFYRYDERGKRQGPDETVYPALGLGAPRQVEPGVIQERLVLAMIDEAARCLGDGVLRSARDGDIGAVMGLGFPPFRGGPFWYVDSLGPAGVVARIDALAAEHGDRFAAALILREAADASRVFREPR